MENFPALMQICTASMSAMLAITKAAIKNMFRSRRPADSLFQQKPIRKVGKIVGVLFCFIF